MSAGNIPSGAPSAPMTDPAPPGTDHASFVDAVRSKGSTIGFSWADADLDEWPDLPIPSSLVSGISMPEFDASWDQFPGVLSAAANVWGVNTSKGTRVGALSVRAWSPGVSLTEEQASAAAYIGGYVEALKPKWTQERLSGDGLHPAFRNGFADAISLVLRDAALTHNVLNTKQANVLLRIPKIGDANEVKNRLQKLMTMPANAVVVSRCIEGLLHQMAKRLSAELVSEALNHNSQNRRSILMNYLPVVSMKVTRKETMANGKTRQVTDTVKQKVHPTINAKYAGLATVTERDTIAKWNRFAKVDDWPLDDRSSWSVELRNAEASARCLGHVAAQIRRMLKDRKQKAYDNLPDAQKKDGKALAAEIDKVVGSIAHDEVAPLVSDFAGYSRMTFYVAAPSWDSLGGPDDDSDSA